ncbi:uncharacterized protein LOC124144803 isoform X1 [Haliotis rufescens]|uniref:uncharacterized protein LOC124144803 isoform X1 n=1 Tax=Haliotis rufescens TaxID=6454 RepID=UPI00201EA4AA|nr:uncharacterized protein LOC124144803 isoform X1 [Haliotis rufescens]
MEDIEDEGDLSLNDDLIDQCDEIRVIAAKNWTGPASVSLARLDQVKTTVYNLGLADPRDLKAPSVYDRNRRNQFLSEIQTDPPLSTVNLQKNAWGSNSSIPELIKHHSEATKTPTRKRPASAKTTGCTRPPSGRKNRPQSAKDLPQTSPASEPITIAVKGSKYDPNGRPPRGPGVGSATGLGWVGPPAGLRIDMDMINPNIAADSNTTIESEYGHYEFSTSGAPPAPCVSPEPGEGTLDNISDVESLPCESHKSYLLRKPTPEPIHLSLPKAEDEEADMDELDTERLLREAESHTTTINTTNNTTNNTTKSSRLVKYNQRSGISYIDTQPVDNSNLSPRDEEQVSGRRSPSLYDVNARTLPVSPSTTSPMQHMSRLNVRSAGRAGVLIREDRNVTVDITPRNAGRKVATLSAGRRGMAKKKFSRSDYSHVRSRINSGVDSSTMLVEKKMVQGDIVTHDHDTLGLELDVRPVTRNHVPVPPVVPTVTVRYDDTESEKSSAQETQEKKKKIRKEIDLITMVSQVSLTESEDNNEDDADEKSSVLSVNNTNHSHLRKNITKFLHPPSNPKLYRSQTEKNYYEVAMRTDRGKSPERNCSEEKENLIYKTIKTFEFDDNMPVEKTERSIIPGTLISTTKPREKLAVAVDYLEQKRMSPRNSAVSIKVPPKTKEPEPEPEPPASTSLGFASLSPEDLEILAKAAAKSEEKFNNMFLAPPAPQRRGRSANTKRHKPKREPTADENIIKIHTESVISLSMQTDAEDNSMLRPTSCLVTSDRKLNADTRRIQSAATAERGPRSSKKRYANYSQTNLSRKKESWDPDSVIYINTKKPSHDLETEENLACQEMHTRMAELGCNVKPETLERALFPPTGKTLYYDLPSELPMSPSDGLLSHPRFWLPKEYNKFKLAEKQLARADHLLWLQKRDEDRRTKSAMELKTPGKKKKKKGKTKGKKKGKASRSNSIC